MKPALAQRGSAATKRSRQDKGACCRLVGPPRRETRGELVAMGGDELGRVNESP
ncbi:MAG TPA: hypothetical protein PLW35_04070 [Verrucomicrobiota bacterium]|nr:hypothetical protein [Verrucomicrobiota bacterium]